MFRRGTASGNLVEVHIIVNRYWLPPQVLGSGPTHLNATNQCFFRVNTEENLFVPVEMYVCHFIFMGQEMRFFTIRKL